MKKHDKIIKMRGRITLPDAGVGVVLFTQVDASDAILVVGSSLEVYGAFRFVEQVLDFQPVPTLPMLERPKRGK